MNFSNLKDKTFSKVFTTAPKTKRRKNRRNIIRERCEDLIMLQFPAREVSYQKLKMDMITKLGLCDRTTIIAYLGRPQTKVMHRVDQEVRYARSGTRVFKIHMFSETVKAKKGFLEIFGLATMIQKNNRTYFKIHYENSNRKYHYTEELISPPLPPSQMFNEGDGGIVPKKNSLSPIITGSTTKNGTVQTPLESETEELKGEEKEKRDVII